MTKVKRKIESWKIFKKNGNRSATIIVNEKAIKTTIRKVRIVWFSVIDVWPYIRKYEFFHRWNALNDVEEKREIAISMDKSWRRQISA